MLPLLILLSCFGSLAWSIPVSPASGRVLMNYQADSHSRFESGTPGDSVQGYYSWTDGEKIYRVDYTANKDGYKPVLTTRLIGAADNHHQQQQHPPPTQAVLQKPESVQSEPVANPPVPILPVVPTVPAAPAVPLAPVSVNKPVHITDDAVIIEADYPQQAGHSIDQNQLKQPEIAYDLYLLNYVHQLLQYQDRLIQARQYLEAYQEELMAQRLSALTSDESNENEQYQQLAKQFSFMSREDYEYEQLAKQLSFPPKNDDVTFRNNQVSDYSHQLYENQQQLQHVQHQLYQLYNYIGLYD